MGLNIDMIVVSMTRIRAYRACATSDPSFPVLASFRFVDIVYILYFNVRKWYVYHFVSVERRVRDYSWFDLSHNYYVVHGT